MAGSQAILVCHFLWFLGPSSKLNFMSSLVHLLAFYPLLLTHLPHSFSSFALAKPTQSTHSYYKVKCYTLFLGGFAPNLMASAILASSFFSLWKPLIPSLNTSYLTCFSCFSSSVSGWKTWHLTQITNPHQLYTSVLKLDNSNLYI